MSSLQANIEFAPTNKEDMFSKNYIKIRRGELCSPEQNNGILCNLRLHAKAWIIVSLLQREKVASERETDEVSMSQGIIAALCGGNGIATSGRRGRRPLPMKI